LKPKVANRLMLLQRCRSQQALIHLKETKSPEILNQTSWCRDLLSNQPFHPQLKT